jgi:hypothetical protein
VTKAKTDRAEGIDAAAGVVDDAVALDTFPAILNQFSAAKTELANLQRQRARREAGRAASRCCGFSRRFKRHR